MGLQIFFVLLFALNMFLLWMVYFINKWQWYRLLGSLIFTFLPFATIFFAQPRFELDYFWWRIAGLVAIILGVILAGWAEAEMGRKGERIFDLIPKHLVIKGPYHFIRHPYYTGLIFMFVGWWWVWAAVYSFYFGMFILFLIWLEAYLEEKLIFEKKFGQEFHRYRFEAGMFWIK